MNDKDHTALIAAVDRALAVFDSNPSNRATARHIYDALLKIRAELVHSARTQTEGDGKRD